MLCDENTFNHCYEVFCQLIALTVQPVVIKAGEAQKNIATCEFIWQKLIDNNADKNACIINLGGGVVSDIGGFVAATYKRGIKYIKAVIKPNFNVKIPLEIIFKIIHATKENPLIKYNPSSRQENIYRLFADKISTDGRKIPFLKKSTIFKLMKTIGRTKCVAVYIESGDQSLICEFDEEGYITIFSEFKNVVSVDEINNIFQQSINPLIQEIKIILEQSGYKLSNFENLNDENVEIKQLTYESQIIIKKSLNIDAYRNCISSVFINETNKFKGNTINLRFKRVSNYSKFNSQEAFILEKSAQGLRGEEIIESLLENFPEDLNRKQAVEMVMKIANELEVEHGVRKSDIKIKNNPGFKTIISIDKSTGIITITTENINNINYLYTLPIYLDTMIRLTQDKNSTLYPVSEINEFCIKGEKGEFTINDIISSVEESANNSDVATIEDEDVLYDNLGLIPTEKPKGALSLFFDDEEEEENNNTEEEFKGGSDSDSGSSISTEPTSESEKNISSISSIDSASTPLSENKELESFGSDLSSPLSEKNVNEQIIESPQLESPVVESPVAESPVVESPVVESPVVESPVVESPVVESPVVESPVAETPVVESPVVESPVAESPVVESPVVESPESEIVSPESELKSIVNEPTKLSNNKESISFENVTEPTEKIPTLSIDEKEISEPVLENIRLEEQEEEEQEEQEEEEEEEQEEEEQEEEEDEVRNIDGMKLNKPYYFQNLIEKKDPILILKEDTPQFNSYTRTCSSTMRRQPVILTDTQLEKIKKEQPNFLRDEDVIKYGSNPDNQFNYICPRYWCLKTNSPIDPKDLKKVIGKDGKMELVHPTCGKVLPKNEKTIKPGYYIYEFYKPEHKKIKQYKDAFDKNDNDNDGFITFDEFKLALKKLKEVFSEKSMQEMFNFADKDKKNKLNFDEFIDITTPKKYPSLIPDSHPDGFCLPCCFDKYNTEGRIKAMEKCSLDKNKEKIITIKDKIDEQDEYVKSPEKFPIDQGRWGYLPVEIQTFLHVVNADCQISNTNTNIKENHPCLLRHGIEINTNQSFIACISDVLFFAKKVLDKKNKPTIANILNIEQMKDLIINSITIDSFIKYQNGNLVIDFQDLEKYTDINKYNNSKLYSKLNFTKNEDKVYFTKVASAYENFISFLKDPDVLIDHTYLWDIISMPNKFLFPNGINLVILKLNDDDITNNVSILCPTNHYSSEFYQARKPTIIIIKKDEYYEPIYSYTNNNLNGEKNILITKEFKEYDPKLSKTMRAVFKEIIKPFFELICRPLDSMPNVYKSKRAIFFYDLVQKLDKYEYIIKKLVVNFNNKVIGVVAEEPNTGNLGFIPCYPSHIDDTFKKDLDYVFMTDLGLWNNYKNTIEFLNKLDKRSKKRREQSDIPCKPEFKVVEDEHVVGILTSSNQFIQLSQPLRLDEVPSALDIPTINNNNYIIDINKSPMVQSEIEFTTQTDVDKERVDYIKKIKLETSFYNVFRNTIRILINNYENSKLREQIEKEMLKEYIIYSEKLKNIDKYLRDLVKNKIQFVGDENYYKLINEVSTCIVKDVESCNSVPNLCAVTENGECNLILPEKNLITKKLNEPIYYGRMADELIRYTRIKSFMLQPQTYLSFGNIGYNLRDDEIILIQSLLSQEYFESLIPATTNKYAKYLSYDEVEPIKTQVYENIIQSLDNGIGKKNEIICNKIKKDFIKSTIWKSCFPENYNEFVYGKNNVCTFEFIIDLIERKTGQKFTINQIKNQLFDEYKVYLGEYMNKILDILILEGKKTLGDQVYSGTLTFSNLIYTDNYFLTPLDLWLLVVKYEIPSIFISQKTILQTNYQKHEFLAYGNREDDFAFIFIPGLRPENIPEYKIVLSNDGDVFISLNKLNDECVERIYEVIDNPISIKEYLSNFIKPKATIYVKKKPAKPILILSDTDDEKEEPKIESKPKIQRKKKIVIEEENEQQTNIELIQTKKQTKKRVTKPKKDGTKKIFTPLHI